MRHLLNCTIAPVGCLFPTLLCSTLPSRLARSSTSGVGLLFSILLCSTLPPSSAAERFTTQPGFKVEQLVGKEIGSLVSMTFDEQGNLLCGKEGGPVLLVTNLGELGKSQISTFCDKLTNCQGLLAYRGATYIVGNGPDGTALYRVTNDAANGDAQKVEAILKFRGGMGEHGPHQPTVGPDGKIYLMIGNHAGLKDAPAASSPHHHYYEADLLTPKYEDANGHASGIKSPGGTVARFDADGKNVELFCGGFRNSYDLAFNGAGELFTFDSDMEWDENLPWYRPTRVNHLVPGGEYGWRSGWSKWPDYYVDSLGSVIDNGRGSPTGITFYQHTAYPEKYRGALFMTDWSRGRILAIHLKANGATFKGEEETFLEGKPLNTPDIEVGPDGSVYFCTGGRGTEGGIYRIVATTTSDARADSAPKTGIDAALAQPQLNTAWSRHVISDLKAKLGPTWETDLNAAAADAKRSSAERVQALHLLQLFGPAPSEELLLKLTHDNDHPVCERAIYLLGLHSTDAVAARLSALLTDGEARVRRLACESLVRIGKPGPVPQLVKLLGDTDHFVAWSAMRVLQNIPLDQWSDSALKSESIREFTMGSVALLGLNSDKVPPAAILARAETLFASELSDADQLDLLRIAQVALAQGKISPENATGLRDKLSPKFPAKNSSIQRELVRLLVYLQDPTLAPRLIAELEGKSPDLEKFHIAMYARFLKAGWANELRSKLLTYYDSTKKLNGGNSFHGYFQNGANDFIREIPPEDRLKLLTTSSANPSVYVQLLRNLPNELGDSTVSELLDVDKNLDFKKPDSKELGRELILALGRTGDDAALNHLRQVFESSPERRSDVALALSQHVLTKRRTQYDWQLLCRSLVFVEGNTAREVMRSLVKFDFRSNKPELRRNAILLGLKLKDQGGQEALALMKHWTGKTLGEANAKPTETLALWQKWFAEEYPDLPEAKLPETDKNKWKLAQLLSHLENPLHVGDATRGAAVFDKANCVKCHKFANRGEGIGPDLSAVTKRFQRKEIIESVLFPSLVISDQFIAKNIQTKDGRQFMGIVGEAGDNVVVLQPNAEKVTIAKKDIEQMVASKISAMPEGAFDKLTIEEITDLFAYLYSAP